MTHYYTLFQRRLLRNKTSFLLNLAGLTLGIGCFLFCLMFVFYERGYDGYNLKKDRISRLVTDLHAGGVTTKVALAWGFLHDQVPKQFPEIEQWARFEKPDGHVGLRRRPSDPLIHVQSLYYADEEAFSIFTWRFKEGDPATALKMPNSIVLTSKLREILFGRTPAVGEALIMNGKLFKVTGVIEDIPGNSDLSFEALVSLNTLPPSETQDFQYTYILFRSADAARAFQPKLDAYAKKVINPEVNADVGTDAFTYFTFPLQPLSTLHFAPYRERDTTKGNPIYVDIFLITGILILLIACSNSINLTIVQSFSRVTDTTIRKIYGAGRTKLILQHGLESTFVALVAILLAFLLVWLLLPVFSSAVNRNLAVSALLNWKVVTAAVAVLVLMALGGTIYTGVYLNKVQPADALRTRNFKVRGLRIFPRLMLGFQFFISVGMLIAAISVYRQVRYFRSVPLGYNPDNVLIVHMPEDQMADTGNIYLSGSKYLLNTLDHDPDVIMTSACDENALPGSAAIDIDIYNYKENGVKVKKAVYHIDVDAHYLSLLQIPVIQGDAFPNKEDSTIKNNAIVTTGFARMAGWTHPIGEVLSSGNQHARVIGVVPEFHYGSLHHAIQPMVVFQEAAWDDLLVRVGQANTSAVLKRLAAAWKNAFPEIPLSYTFLDEQLRQQYLDEYNLLDLLLTLTMLMIAISCVGLVAYVSFLLRMARAEIAIRRVIGASFPDIYGLFARQFLFLLLIAFVVAGPLAWWFSDAWLKQFAYHVDPRPVDLVIALGAMCLLVGVIVLRWSWMSVRVNPARVLRED
jgi:putative ABC transport system permease protein